jgi:hypothetical protein
MKNLVTALFIISLLAWLVILNSGLDDFELLASWVLGLAFLIITAISVDYIPPKSTLGMFLEVRRLELEKKARDLRKELGVPEPAKEPNPKAETNPIEASKKTTISNSAEESKSATDIADKKKSKYAALEKIFVLLLIISIIVAVIYVVNTYHKEQSRAVTWTIGTC